MYRCMIQYLYISSIHGYRDCSAMLLMDDNTVQYLLALSVSTTQKLNSRIIKYKDDRSSREET